MKSSDRWYHLRFGTQRQAMHALRHIREAYGRDPDASHIMELGAAYLWIGQYETAWEHFYLAIQRHPTSVTDFYGMAGVGKWCLGEYEEAVASWVAGLEAEFADAAGLGIHLPLLLFFAAALKPALYTTHSAEQLLREKSKDSRITEWPGPIASWLLGETEESELRDLCKGEDDSDTHDHRWLCEFYRGVLRRADGRHSTFREAMRELADTSGPQWSDDTFFLARMWSEEFFLARYEAK